MKTGSKQLLSYVNSFFFLVYEHLHPNINFFKLTVYESNVWEQLKDRNSKTPISVTQYMK